jgi:hypothetical protein
MSPIWAPGVGTAHAALKAWGTENFAPELELQLTNLQEALPLGDLCALGGWPDFDYVEVTRFRDDHDTIYVDVSAHVIECVASGSVVSGCHHTHEIPQAGSFSITISKATGEAAFAGVPLRRPSELSLTVQG